MPIIKTCKKGTIVIEVNNDLIGYQAMVFGEFCQDAMAEEGIRPLIINLQEVKSIDSLGTSEICRLIEKGTDIRLINVSHNVGLFLKCHAPFLLERLCSTEEEAVKLIDEKGLPPKKPWAERREFRRKNIQFPVFINWMGVAAGAEEVEGAALNLSGGGLLLYLARADYPLFPKERLMLRLLIPESPEPISAQGQLIRSVPQKEKWHLGIKFTNIDAADRNRIVDYVHDRLNSA